MHYYKRNLGDYAKKTGRLSMLEHGAYTLLIDACYDRERFPTMAEAVSWCWARSADEIAAVEFVLDRFFTKDGDMYVQARIQEEIAKYHQNAQINSRIATEREAKRTKRAQTVNEPSTLEHEPPPNQEPRTKNQVNTVAKPDGVDEVVWSDFLKVRKAKKAPLTTTSMEGIKREASLAGWTVGEALQECATRGWQSFKADWVKGQSNSTSNAFAGAL